MTNDPNDPLLAAVRALVDAVKKAEYSRFAQVAPAVVAVEGLLPPPPHPHQTTIDRINADWRDWDRQLETLGRFLAPLGVRYLAQDDDGMEHDTEQDLSGLVESAYRQTTGIDVIPALRDVIVRALVDGDYRKVVNP